jgi:hypothetical protein
LKEAGFKVSAALERAFVAWMIPFFKSFDDGFDWPTFHRTGIELARRLKAEIGDQARVNLLHGLHGRPRCHIRATKRIEILADGTLQPITVRLWSPPEEVEPIRRAEDVASTGKDTSMTIKADLIETPKSPTPWMLRIDQENAVVCIMCSSEDAALAVKRTLEEHGARILITDW